MMNNYQTLRRRARISTPVLSCLLLCLLFLGTKIQAQQSSYYTFSTGTTASLASDLNGNAIDMSTGTTQLVAASADDVSSAAQGMDLVAGTSFTFRFMGTNYTTFSANENGVMTLGATTGTTAYTVGANTVATITPFGNDMRVGTNGKVHAKIVGSAPNRTLVIEWQNIMVRYLATAAAGSGTFQVRLYETSNNFEFVYGDMATNTSTPTDYYIGFSNNTTVDNVMSVNTTTQTESVYYITNNTYVASSTVAPMHSTTNGSRRYYLFTAPDPALAPLNGPYTVDNTTATGGLNFRTIKDAVRALNVRGISGPVTFNVTAGQTFAEEIMPVRMTGTAANTITFQKSGAGANPEIQKAGGTFGADAGIYFRGGDYYTFDGINVTATNATAEYGYYIFNNSATDGAQNNTIKNCTITLNRTLTASRAIYQNVATTPTSAAGANSNNKYYNLNIRNTNGGIYLAGNATYPDLGCEIGTTACNIFNSIGDPSVANDIGNTTTAAFGIRATNQSGVLIFNNNVRNVSASAASADGIFVETFQGTSSVYNNRIQTVRNISTSSTTSFASGIRATHTTTGTHTLRIYNNAVSDMTSAYTGSASASRTLKGIYLSGTGGTTAQSYQIYNNTVAINGSGSLSLSSVCFEISTTSGPVYNLANNIFANLTPAQTGIARHYGIFSTSATAFGAAGTTSNNNDIFILNDVGTTGFAVLGNATNYNTVAAWTTASTFEAASLALNPGFTAYPTDVHAGNAGLDGTASALQAFVTNDLDCAARTDNDFGAYNITTCTGIPVAGTITGANAVCSGLGTTLSLNGASTAAGVVYQWFSSTTAGGPYTTMLGTAPAQASGPLSTTTYYIVEVTCVGSGQMSVTPEYTVTVNANPTVAVTASSATYCAPGAGVTLTASNATTYTWTPATGLSATTGSSVSATPAANTTYTVTGTDGNGCIGTANTAVASSTLPFITAATATPSSVCSGASSQLQVIATGSTSTASTYSFSAGSGTYTPIAGTVLTGAAMIGDDVGVGNLPIGFPFSYNGNYFTVFGLRSNGLIELGQTAATLSGFSANALATNANCIAPLWDDNNTVGATVSYQTTGTAPNRILTVQWTNIHIGGSGSGTNPTISMQVLLYEANGRIQFIYGPTSAAFTSTSASIGISGAVGNYKSVTPLLPVTSSTVSSGTENTGINSATNIPSGTIYTFDYTSVASTNVYAWTPATFLNDATITNPLASNITASTTYTVSVTTPSGCAATASVAISAGAALTSVATVSSGTVCAGANVTFTATPTGGGAPYSYAWTGPNSFTSALQSPVINGVTAAAAGVYSVVITDNCAATSTATVSLTVDAAPPVAVTPTTGLICLPGGSAVSLMASGANTYTWTPATGLSATTGASVSANPTATTNYVVTGTGANGCTATATATISVLATPVVSAVTATPSSLCSGGNSQLNATVSVGNAILITEVTLYSTGTGATSPYPAHITGADLVEISNISGSPVNISGYQLMDYSTNSATANHPFTFPAGTIIPANGVAVVNLGSGTDNVANRYFNTGGSSDFYSSGGLLGVVLKNGATILDAVALNSGYVFNAGTGVTAADWSGFAPSAGGYAGSIRTAANDNNAGSDWAQSNSPSPLQTIGTYNAGYIAPGSPTYSWLPTTFLSDPAIVNPMANGVTGTTTYTLTVSNGGCTATGTVTLNIDPLATVTVTATSASLCAGASSTLTAAAAGGGTPYTYVWAPGGATTNTVTVNPSASTVYTVTVTDACGATMSNTVSINVNALPVVTATATANSYCTPGSPAIVINAGGADTYSWLPAAGLNVTTGAAVNATPASSTTYTVTGTDAITGCVNTATVSILAVPAITGVTASVSDATICLGDTISLTSTAASQATLISENFNGATNNWTVSTTATGANQAQQGWNLYTSGYTPGGTWTGPVVNLDASQFYMTNSDVGGTSSGVVSTLTSPRIDASAMSTLSLSFEHFYKRYNGVDEGKVQISTNGTTYTDLQTYAANTNLQNAWAAATFNLNAYAGNDTIYIRFRYNATWDFGWGIDNVSLIGTSSAMNYAWTSVPAGFTSAVQNPVNVVPAASATYSVTVSNTFGCSASAATSVTVNAVPTVSLGNDTAVCAAGLPLTLDAGNAGAAYAWSTTATTQTVSVNAGGSYNVAVTDANGCVGRDTLAVTVNASPVVTLGTDTIRCGGTVTLDAANAGSTYEWNDMTTAQTLTVTASGTYSVVVTDANGCEGSDAILVTINSIPAVSLGNDTAVCSADLPLILDAGNAGAAYVWSTTATTQTISVNAGGSYHVAVTGGNGCIGNDTIAIAVNASPVVALGTDTIRCGGTVTLDAGNAGSAYEWNDLTTAQTLVATTSGTYSVVVTDANGCEGSDAILVTINTIPTVALGNDTTVCGGAVTLDAGNAGADFLWNTTAATQTISVSTGGQYFVEVTNAQNCSATDTITVTFAPAIDVNLGNDSAICASVNIVLNAQNAGSTYLWNDNSNASVLTVTSPGTYFVEVTSADGCVAQDTIVFTDNSPLVTLSLPFTTTCENTAVNPLSGGSPVGGTYSGTGVTGTNFNAGAAGSYNIIYTFMDGVTGCSSADTQTVVVDPCIGVKDLSAAASISVAPNPTTGYFSILSPSRNNVVKAEMYTVEGQLIYSETLKGREEYEMNITNLANAIYYLRLTVDGTVNVVKVVKQQ